MAAIMPDIPMPDIPGFMLKTSRVCLTFDASRTGFNAAAIVAATRRRRAILRRGIEQMAFVNDGHELCIYIQTRRRFTQKYKPGTSRIFKVTIGGSVHEPVVEPRPRREQDWMSGHASYVVP